MSAVEHNLQYAPRAPALIDSEVSIPGSVDGRRYWRNHGTIAHLPLPAIVGAVVLLVAAPAYAAPINLVTNGGFETGSFAGWTSGGNTGFMGVQCPGPGPTVNEGNCAAFAGPVGSDGTLSQVLATAIGGNYLISFAWLPDGGTPSDFSASFGGSTLFSVTNPPASVYHVMSFLRTATAASTTLSFSFRDDPGFLFFDAVSVTQAPEPATLSLLGLGLVSALLRRKRVS